VLIALVHIAAGGVRLPDFEQGMGYRPSGFVEHAAFDDDAFAERFAVDGGVLREVAVQRVHVRMPVNRPGQFGQRLGRYQEGALRPAQCRRCIGKMDVGRVRFPVSG
jgi:hypothetical protein